MKRWLAALLTVMLCGVMLSGCNDAKPRSDGNEQTDDRVTTHLTDTQTTATTTLAPTSTTLATSSTLTPTSTTLVATSTTNAVTEPTPTAAITLEEPPYYLTHFCDSYTELLKALTVPGSEGYDYVHGEMSVSGTVHSATKPFGNVYSNMLTLLETGKLNLLVPQRNRETMPLCDDGMIALLSVDLYGLPWIWYRSDVDDHIVRVQYTYVGAIDDPRLEQVTNIREFLSLIAPTAPSPTNYHNHPVYKRIYEQDLVLADGSSVLAWIYERKDSSQANVQYYKDGVVVWMYADEQLIADGLLSTFDLVPYSEAVG